HISPIAEVFGEQVRHKRAKFKGDTKKFSANRLVIAERRLRFWPTNGEGCLAVIGCEDYLTGDLRLRNKLACAITLSTPYSFNKWRVRWSFLNVEDHAIVSSE